MGLQYKAFQFYSNTMDTLKISILKQLGEIALDCGFTHIGDLDTATIKIHSEVRDACTMDRCHSYGKNWACPPACGSLEECEKRIRQYTTGLILQTSGNLENSLDYKSMTQIGEEHKIHLKNFQKKLASFFTPAQSWMLLGAGACNNCEQCTCPQSPCRFPEKMVISLEAMGIYVSEFCKANNIPYYYGPNTLTYIGCVLI